MSGRGHIFMVRSMGSLQRNDLSMIAGNDFFIIF